MGQFDEKVAIVTGAGGGIGQAYAEALAREGAAVVVADINTEGAQKVADGNALAVHVDVSDPESAKERAAQTLSEFGGIDYLVNNAAIFGGMKLDFLITVDWDYYKKFMSVNMDGALVCTRAVYRKMAKRGGGAIVNQSSTAAWLYSNFYGLAKVGVNGLTQQLATELGGQNIRVNAIAPGPIDTEANRTSTPKEIVDRLSKALQKALADDNVKKRFAQLGTTPSSQEDATPEALKKKLVSEVALWKPIIEANGQYAD